MSTATTSWTGRRQARAVSGWRTRSADRTPSACSAPGAVLSRRSPAAQARVVADERAARWTALVVAALTSTTLINANGVKGELLSLPFLLGAVLLSLLVLRHGSPVRPRPGCAAGIPRPGAVGEGGPASRPRSPYTSPPGTSAPGRPRLTVRGARRCGRRRPR